MRIHHATAAKANKLGITLQIEENEIVASKGDKVLASGMSGNVVLEQAIAALGGEAPAPKAKKAKAPAKKKAAKRRAADADEDGDEDGEDEEEGGKSVIKRKYKQRYKPFKMTCGDDLAGKLRKHVEDEDGAVDVAALKRFAKANSIWDDRYNHLNVGMQRMNVGNRLRGLVKKKMPVQWV